MVASDVNATALFLRVEIEEQSSRGWQNAVRVFGGGTFDKKLYRRVVRRTTLMATKFIEKFMKNFDYRATGTLRKIKKRILNVLKRKHKSIVDETVRTGHVFAKLMTLMWANGNQHQIGGKGDGYDEKFHLARMYQALTVLNHGELPQGSCIRLSELLLVCEAYA